MRKNNKQKYKWLITNENIIFCMFIFIVNNLLFIDKIGTNIICTKEKKYYAVRTCYRKNPFYRISGMKHKFKKMQNDLNSIVKKNAIAWIGKMKKRGDKNIILHLPENW